MFKRIRSILKFNKNDKEMVNIKENDSRNISDSTISKVNTVSNTYDDINEDDFQQYTNDKSVRKSFSRRILSSLSKKSFNKKHSLKRGKKKFVGLFKIKRNNKDRNNKKNDSYLEDIDYSNSSNQWLSDSSLNNLSSNESSDYTTNTHLQDNSQYQFIMNKIQNKNAPKINKESSLVQSSNSNYKLESINSISSPSMKSKFEHLNKNKQISSAFSENEIKYIKNQNESGNETSNSNNTILETSPVPSVIHRNNITPPETPKSTIRPKKESCSNIIPKSKFSDNKFSETEIIYYNQVKENSHLSDNQDQLNNNETIIRKASIDLNENTSSTPEYNISIPVQNQQKKIKNKKLVYRVKSFFKKALSIHSKNKILESNVDYKMKKIDVSGKESTITSIPNKNNNLNSSSISNKNLTTSPESIDSYENDGLKGHETNELNNVNNWNSALGQYISKIKKRDKIKKNMAKKSNTSLSNVISLCSKSNESSSTSSSTSTISTLTKDNMTLAATIDSNTLNAKNKNENKNNGKRYAYIFNNQEVLQEFKRVKNEENIKDNNSKLNENQNSTSLNNSWSTVSESYLDETSGIRMKLDKSEYIELNNTEENVESTPNSPKTEVETWNDEELNTNILNNIKTELIELNNEKEDTEDDNSEDWDTVSESDSNSNDYSNSSQDIDNKKSNESLSQCSTVKLVNSKINDSIMKIASSFTSELSKDENSSQSIDIKKINENSIDTSLTTSIYKSSPFIEEYMNSTTSSQFDNEIAKKKILETISENSNKNESEIDFKNGTNNGKAFLSFQTEKNSIIANKNGNITSYDNQKIDEEIKIKLLTEAVHSYKDSINNEQLDSSLNNKEISSYIKSFSNETKDHTISQNNVNETFQSRNNTSLIIDSKLPFSNVSSLEDDSIELDDIDSSSICVVIDEPQSLIFSNNSNISKSDIDSSESNISNKGLNSHNINNSSHLSNTDSNNSCCSKEYLSINYSSKIPSLINKTSLSLGVTSTMISSSTMTTTSNISSHLSNIPDLVTDVSGYASSNIPFRNSFSIPTTISTSSSDVYSPLLSSEIPRMPSNVSIGIIGGDSDNQHQLITTYLSKPYDISNFNLSKNMSDNVYNYSLNEIDINQSSIPNTGLIQKIEFSPIDDSSTSNAGSSSLNPPKLNYDSPTVLNKRESPLQPRDEIYNINSLSSEIENESNTGISYYDYSYITNESSSFYYNESIYNVNNKKKNEYEQIQKFKEKQTKSVYSRSSLLVINDPKEEYNNLSNFYSKKEIEEIESKDDNYLSISKEFTINNDQLTDENTSYIIDDVKPTFNIDTEYNISNIKDEDSNYLIKSKSYSYKEYGEDTRRNMIYEFCKMLSKKYDKENMIGDISSNFDEDNSITLNPRQDSNNSIAISLHQDSNNSIIINPRQDSNNIFIDFSFGRTNQELLNSNDFFNNNYLNDSKILTSNNINLPLISLPPPLSPKDSNTKLENMSISTQLSLKNKDIINRENYIEYNKSFDEDQNISNNLNSYYYGCNSSSHKSPIQKEKYIKYQNDEESYSSCSSCNTCSCSSCQNDSKEYAKTERKNQSGIIERSLNNIEEYNKSKNEIIIDQDIISEVFTEKSKNVISSSDSYYSISHSSFDDIGFDFFYNEYNNSNNENNSNVVKASEKLEFYYLDAADIYGINSDLRNNSDIQVIPSSSFKNPDFMLGSVNTIHAYIEYNELKFKNSYINENNHYKIPDIVDVVLKVIKPEIDKQMLKKNIKQINEWACLQRFNPIYGVSTYFNEEVLVTQFYKNGSLGQYLTTNSSISFEEKEEIVVDIVEGLNICHSHDLIHGNLKPSNILLDEYYHALLSDFSMSRISSSLPKSIKQQWLAPELKERCSPLTTASDIYSLGLIIYYIFNDGVRYIPNVSSKPNFSDKNWPKNIITILEHCLLENPNDRWTIKEILNHLKMHYQFGSIVDKYLNRKSTNKILSEANLRNKGCFSQENDLNYYNKYPKLERFKRFSRYNQYYQYDNNSSNNRDLQFALRALKNSLYFSDWNYTQAMKLMTGSKEVPCNISKAIQRLIIPCSEGHIDSLLRLGLCYFDGQGVAKNKAKAYSLWNIAVEVFPKRHALGGKYQPMNKNFMTKTSFSSPSSNYIRAGVGSLNNGSIMSSPRTLVQSYISPRIKNSTPRMNINSPIASKSIYIHNNGSNYSYDSLLQKKQNLYGLSKCNERTLDLWKEVAEREFIPAYIILGKCYRDGILVESDIANALIWFKRAAHMNDINGCWYLAHCYFIYYDNYQDAFTWLLKASRKKHPEADTALGLLYYYGLGIPRNINEALSHFQYAADLGNANAQYLYCECLDYVFKEKKFVMPKSITDEEKSIHYDKLFHYCSMAATQGNSRAQFLLGKLYLDGSLEFVNNDTSTYKFNSSIGLQWIRLSAENGYKKAKEFLIEIL
ncbi:hypothetical protein BCR36DRAFT_584597 [Piromyces finnis]|uniref:Protein kinase domain-containing protein n=1 Tax=Piromyces finnis TaxID=1754191 RepID=A0A1Y1V5V4_9FUNG|nr:hypothetical protein BCR36DRAFT_584597 [Piromyces finnis]|eukprot:ORX47900.1 hypothetical protein BCR36DRAFT_584597 [Piromyces finnis]